MSTNTDGDPPGCIISEFGVSPAALRDPTNGPHCEMLREQELLNLKRGLIFSGVVRDFCDGSWSKYCLKQPLQRKAMELLKAIRSQGRLTRERTDAEPPTTDHGWLEMALQSHYKNPLSGIVCDESDLPRVHAESKSCVIPLSKLSAAKWWKPFASSVRLTRTLEHYIAAARSILENASHLALIDPHLDPSQPRYKDVVDFVCASGTRTTPMPRIEIHRVCYVGSRKEPEIPGEAEWKKRFNDAFAKRLSESSICVDVFIWDDFHDRYLLSNIAGILMANGFDTTTNPIQTTWAIVSRADRESIQKEFDSNSLLHKLKFHFRIGE